MRTTVTNRRVVFLLAAILVCGAWLTLPGTALAHAQLVQSTPAAGQVLDSPPDKIVLVLSETASAQFSSITVLDRGRHEQPVGKLTSEAGGTTITAPLTEQLQPGTYTVVWRVLSTADGHLTAGSFAFRVRAAGAGAGTTANPEEEPLPPAVSETAAPGGMQDAAPDPLRWLARAVVFACAAFLLGGSLFIMLIARPVLADMRPQGAALEKVAARRFGIAGAWAAALLFLGLVLDLVLQVAAIAQTDLWGALLQGSVAGGLVTSTRYGVASLVEAAAAVALFGLMLLLWKGRRAAPETALALGRAVALAALVFFVAQALSSHAAAAGTEQTQGSTVAAAALVSVPWISDLLHLLTASAWAGGLAFMALVLFPSMRAANLAPGESRALLGRAIPRFSRVALFSVAALGVTGLYNLLVHSTDLQAILGSAYGQVLAIKVGLFVLLVALGAANLLRLSPALQKSQGQPDEPAAVKPVTSLGKNVRLEVALTLAVFACAAGLSLLPPPGNASATTMQVVAEATPQATPTTEPVALPPTPGPATAQTTLAGYSFSLLTRPDIDGDQLTLTITRDAPAAAPLTDVSKVLIRVTPQDIDAGSTSYPAAMQGELSPERQVWTVTEPILTLDGGYLITAIVQRTQSPDLRAGFRLDLTQDNVLKAASSEVVEVQVETLPSPPITGTATVNLHVVNGAGQPIDGAKVTVNPLMPAHAHSEPVTQASAVSGKPGTYTLPVNFVMPGSWLLVFTVERAGLPPMKVDASLDVLDPNATPTP